MPYGIKRTAHIRMLGPIERDIMDRIAGVGYSDALDVASSAWLQAVVIHDVYKHGHGRDITKDKNEKGAERKAFVSEEVIRVNADS